MHLIVRGNGRQILFEDEQDHLVYLSLLKKYSAETNVKVCAYCLMENHVHLLAFDQEDNVPLFMKKTGVSYARYYNTKYDRSGHLYQDRYKSEPIESEDYLLTVFRYILNNPAKAGICSAAEYRWSSYKAYSNPGAFVDPRVYRMFFESWNVYADYIAAKNEDNCMEYEQRDRRQDDDWACSVIRKELNLESGTMLQRQTHENRDAALRLLKDKGLTIRQIERLTGINRGVIQRA